MLTNNTKLFGGRLCYLSKLPSLSIVQQRLQGGFVPSDMPRIKSKWSASVSVGKICESMKNVAAGALPGAEKHLSRARPFGSVLLPLFDLEHEPSDIKNVLHVCIGTEKGLCGVVSSNTLRAADHNVQANPQQNHKVVIYGKRSAAVGNSLFGNRVAASVGDLKTKVPTFEFCCQLAEHILYSVKDWDKMILYYNRFVNAMQFSAEQVPIYQYQLAELIAQSQIPAYEIEADPASILGSLVEFKLASAIYLFLAENYAAEQGSRLRSMDTAFKNCNELAKEYERIYQGLRKTKITNELIVLSVGVKLSKMKK